MTQPKHSIAFSDLAGAVNTAVERAMSAQGQGHLRVDKGLLMGRMIAEQVATGAQDAAAAKTGDHHGLAAAITTEVSKQTHLQLTPEVVQVRPGHIIVGFIYQPAVQQ